MMLRNPIVRNLDFCDVCCYIYIFTVVYIVIILYVMELMHIKFLYLWVFKGGYHFTSWNFSKTDNFSQKKNKKKKKL